MKNLILTTLLLSFSLPAFSAVTGSLLIKAAIPRKVSITVAPVAVASALDLSTTQTNLKVATVTAKSNSNTGFKVTFTSANLGKLKRVGGAEVFSYALKVDGYDIPMNTPAGTTFLLDQSSPVTMSRDLMMSYTGKAPETMIEGTYSDTITLNIAAR